MNSKPRDAMKQEQYFIRKMGKFARYALVSAAIGLFTAAPSMLGAGMNASNPSYASAAIYKIFQSLSAVIPLSEPVFHMEDDRQIKPDTTIARTDESAPTKLFMDQNYPNPFRLSTSIRYGLPRASFVKVTIHTMLGNPVKTLLEETQDAGIYSLDVTLPDLMPGIYFYRIETEYGALTRRMTISR